MEMTEECPLCNRLRRRHLGDLCPKHFAERLRARFEQLQAEGKVGGGKTEYGGQHHCGTQISHTGGGEWHCPKCNPLLTAEQREEEGKRDA